MIPPGQKFTIGVSQNALRMAHGGITCYDRGGLDSEQNYVTGSLSLRPYHIIFLAHLSSNSLGLGQILTILPRTSCHSYVRVTSPLLSTPFRSIL